jgi:transposase-like protein
MGRKRKQDEPHAALTPAAPARPVVTAAAIAGPRCPECGAADVALLESGSYFGGRTRRKLACRRCSRTFTVIVSSTATPQTDETTIEFHFGKPQICESCQVRGRVYNTRAGLRYVKCPDCGRTWKEVGTEVESD